MRDRPPTPAHDRQPDAGRGVPSCPEVVRCAVRRRRTAYEQGGPTVALATAAGFVLSFVLATL
jgi:hypothetical protein